MLIEMNGFSVKLHRKRIKNINLRIKRTGEVQISAPIRTSIATVHKFLNEKQAWIETHRYQLLQIHQRETSQSFIVGENVYFQGKKYMLCFFDAHENQRIELNDHLICMFIEPEASQVNKEALLSKWFRLQMEQVSQAVFEKWQSILGVDGIQVSIKKMKSRWGSCHPIKKHITLNLRLIEKPLHCLEYVIVHELVHLFEPSHNQRFYTLMSHYLPDWKQIKNELNNFIHT